MIGKHRIGGARRMTFSGDRGVGPNWTSSPQWAGVIRCNDAEVLMDLEDLAERRINNLHAFNKRRGIPEWLQERMRARAKEHGPCSAARGDGTRRRGATRRY